MKLSNGFLLNIIFFNSLLLLQGCQLLVHSVDSALEASKYKKDISDDANLNYLIGKEYELLQDLYLYGFKGEKSLFLDNILIKVNRIEDYRCTFEINSKICTENDGLSYCVIDPDIYSFFKIIPRGTKFVITNIILETSFLGGDSGKHILAKFSDQDGTVVTANVTRLFRDRFKMIDQDEVFIPKPDFLLEIK